MTIKNSGPLTFTEIHDEFKTLGSNFGSKPYALSEYYNLPVGIGLPQSGEIKFSDFYGKSNIIYVPSSKWIDISDSQIGSKYNRRNCDLWESLKAMGYTDPARNYDIILPIDYWLWSSSTGNAGLTVPSNMTGINVFRNSGNIIGKGGNGGNSNLNGSAGGPALEVKSTSPFTLINTTDAFIAGGGGGGSGGRGAGAGGAGGGAGGSGAGTDNNGAGGAGGNLNASGTNGNNASQAGGGKGGGAGGGGGGADNENGCLNDNGAGGGGGGGRILPGVGGAGGSGEAGETGGAGGSGNNAGGAAVSNAGGGGGGWGKSGGSTGSRAGGTGGAAIKTSSNQFVTFNSGAIWGSV